MRSILFFIPLKKGCLKQYQAFASESVKKGKAYEEMLARYNIYCAKTWYKNINDRDYILVYHEVGQNFDEKMKGWDSSTHPFDQWFRESIMAVYDIENAAGMEQPQQLVDFTPSTK